MMLSVRLAGGKPAGAASVALARWFKHVAPPVMLGSEERSYLEDASHSLIIPGPPENATNFSTFCFQFPARFCPPHARRSDRRNTAGRQLEVLC